MVLPTTSISVALNDETWSVDIVCTATDLRDSSFLIRHRLAYACSVLDCRSVFGATRGIGYLDSLRESLPSTSDDSMPNNDSLFAEIASIRTLLFSSASRSS